MRVLSKVELSDCKSLEYLDIFWCGKLQEKALMDVIKMSPIKYLKLRFEYPVLFLNNFRGPSCLAVLDVTSKTLEYLTLEKSPGLTAIKLNSPNLFCLEIRGCGSLKVSYYHPQTVFCLTFIKGGFSKMQTSESIRHGCPCKTYYTRI
jgi:hypothetical protein